jgi:iron complex outermembrane receptor protein
MDEIIVSTPFNKLQSENVMKVEHKTIQQLQRQGASTLIEGLSNITGISQVSTGVSIGKPVIRGLSGNRVLVYAQGVRLENQQFGDEHGLGLNDAGVESVEVIKGPASLLYGSDALGGVLYFNPERFAYSNSVSSTLSQKYFTNTKGTNTTFNFKASAEKLKFLTSIAYTSHIDYKTPNDSRVTNTRFNEYDVKTGLQFSTDKFSSTLRYNYNLLNLGINEGEIGDQSAHRNPDFPKQRVHNHILSLHNHFFLKNSSLDIDIGYLFNDRSEFEDNNQASLRMLLNTLNYDIKYHLPEFKNIESIIGIQGMHQTNTNKAEELLIPDATTNDIGVFGTINYAWKKMEFKLV